MAKKITENERLQLIGLVTLARQHSKVVDGVYEALTKMVGVDGSQIHDCIYDQDSDIDEAIKNADIEVEDATP